MNAPSISLRLAPLLAIVALSGCGVSPLIKAAGDGSLAEVNAVLEKPGTLKSEKGGALLAAVKAGHADVVTALLAKGAPVDWADEFGGTPLMWAANKGRRDVFEALLAAGADPKKRANGGDDALAAAMIGDDPEIVSRLLALGLTANRKHRDGNPPLRAAVNGNAYRCIPVLKKAGTDIEARDAYGNTMLILAASMNRNRTLEALVDAGAAVDARNNNGDTPLGWAASVGNLEGARKLIEAGAHLDQKNNIGQTALMIADIKGSATVAALIRRAIDAAVSGVPLKPQAPAETAPSKAPEAVLAEIAPSYRSPERPADYALVVGVEKYADLPDARFAERDAAEVREHLLALGYPSRNVVLLTGSRATRTGIAKNLESWLANNATEASTVFFYYSGHGSPDPRTGESYLVPSDGDPQYLGDTGYPVKRLYEKLGALKAKRVIVALDSCFSGAGGRSVLAKGTRPLVSKVDVGALSSPKITALTASAADEISGVDESAGHGLFTEHLLRGLNGGAAGPDGGVTVGSLYRYLSSKVSDDARRANRAQTPQLFGEGSEARLR